MATLTLDFDLEMYDTLQTEARRQGKPAETFVMEWVVTHFPKREMTERGKNIQLLREAGLLVESNHGEFEDISLAEVQAGLDAMGGKPLSEIIIEQRGPKV